MRKSWDAYFMDIARAVATRATCDRKHVGAVIVREKLIVSTGYNGSLPGQPHCSEVGHMLEPGVDGAPSCKRTVHAEMNAIIQAARHGMHVKGTTIYTTASPCWACFQAIATAGISRIVFGELYRDARIKDFAAACGIELVDLSDAGLVASMPPSPDGALAAGSSKCDMCGYYP